MADEQPQVVQPQPTMLVAQPQIQMTPGVPVATPIVGQPQVQPIGAPAQVVQPQPAMVVGVPAPQVGMPAAPPPQPSAEEYARQAIEAARAELARQREEETNPPANPAPPQNAAPAGTQPAPQPSPASGAGVPAPPAPEATAPEPTKAEMAKAQAEIYKQAQDRAELIVNAQGFLPADFNPHEKTNEEILKAALGENVPEGKSEDFLRGRLAVLAEAREAARDRAESEGQRLLAGTPAAGVPSTPARSDTGEAANPSDAAYEQFKQSLQDCLATADEIHRRRPTRS